MPSAPDLPPQLAAVPTSPRLWQHLLMAVRPIRLFGDPLLRTKCMPVSDFDRGLRRVVSDLATWPTPGGAGLAAPQIGVNLRVFTYVVLDTEMRDMARWGTLFNPVLVEQSPDEVTDIEGCLSIPGLEYELARSRRVVAEGSDM